jgi:hypothetical protein
MLIYLMTEFLASSCISYRKQVVQFLHVFVCMHFFLCVCVWGYMAAHVCICFEPVGISVNLGMKLLEAHYCYTNIQNNVTG